jgi:hypothetical protein
VSNRTGTSTSKSAVTSTPKAGAVSKVTSPVVVSTDQPELLQHRLHQRPQEVLILPQQRLHFGLHLPEGMVCILR